MLGHVQGAGHGGVWTQATATESANVSEAQAAADDAGLPGYYEAAMGELFSQIIGTALRMDEIFLPERRERLTTAAQAPANDCASLERIVENAVNTLIEQYGVPEQTMLYLLKTLRDDDVQSRISPEIRWVADGFAAVGERRWAAAIAREGWRRPESRAWSDYGGDVFGPNIEEAFAGEADEEPGFSVRPALMGLSALLTGAWLVLYDKLQQFRWAGSGVDYRRGVDYEKHARAASESKANQFCAKTPAQRALLALCASSTLTQAGPPALLGLAAQTTAAQPSAPPGQEIPSGGYLSQLTEFLASWQPSDPLRFPSAGAASIKSRFPNAFDASRFAYPSAAPDHAAPLSASADASEKFHQKLDAAVAKQLAPELDESLLGPDFGNIKTYNQSIHDSLELQRPTVLTQLGLPPSVLLSDIVLLARSPSGDLSGPLDDMVLRHIKGHPVFDDYKLNLTYHLKHEAPTSSKTLEHRLTDDPDRAAFSLGNLAADTMAGPHNAMLAESQCRLRLLDSDVSLMATYGRLYAQAALQRVDNEYAAGRLSEAGALTLKAVCQVPIGTERLNGDDVMRGSHAYLVHALVTTARKDGGPPRSRQRTIPGLMVASRATTADARKGDAGAVIFVVGAPEPFSEHRLEDIETTLSSYRHSAGAETDFLQGSDIARAMRIRLEQTFAGVDFGKEGVTLSLTLVRNEAHIFEEMIRAAANMRSPTHWLSIKAKKFETEGMAPLARKTWLSGQTLEEDGQVARYPRPSLSMLDPAGAMDGAASLRWPSTSIGHSGAQRLRELTNMQTTSALVGHVPKGIGKWSIYEQRERLFEWERHRQTLIKSLKGGFVISAHEASRTGALGLAAKNMVLLSVGGETAADYIELSGLDADEWPSDGVDVDWLDVGVFQSTIMIIHRPDHADWFAVTYDALDPVTQFREFSDEAALSAWYQGVYDDESKRDALTQRFYSDEAELDYGIPNPSKVGSRALGEFIGPYTRASARGAGPRGSGPFAELWDRAKLLLLTEFGDWPFEAWEKNPEATLLTFFRDPAEMASNVASRLGEMASVQSSLFDRPELNSRRYMEAAYGPRMAHVLLARAEPSVSSLDSGNPVMPRAFDRHNSMRIPLTWDIAVNYPGPVMGRQTLLAQADGIDADAYGMVPQFNIMPGLHFSEGKLLAEGHDESYLQVVYDDDMRGWRLCMDGDASHDGPRVVQRPNSTIWEVIPFAEGEADWPDVDDRANFHLARACDRAARQLRFNADASVADAFSHGDRYDGARPLPRNSTLTSYRLAFLKRSIEGARPKELGDLWEGIQTLEAREPFEKFIRLTQRLQSQPGLDLFRAVSMNSRREMDKLEGRGPTTMCLCAARALVEGKLPDAFFVKQGVVPGSFDAVAQDNQVAGAGYKAVRADVKRLHDNIDSIIDSRPEMIGVGEIIDQLRPSRGGKRFIVAQTANHAILFGAIRLGPRAQFFVFYDPEVGVMRARNRLAFERIVTSHLLDSGLAVHAYGAHTRRDADVVFQVADVNVAALMRRD
ncbi:hypothetical protein PPN31114_00935 [Pandoraea pneumonica]|uniref:Dermonecrotic toxin N-terminal domain-containing protein n=1 Tax=Pandoraea pneumonica TaxID=2508299 RepID=A0A5E4STP3_9BURK|nr:hypothetical protein PPN31114_00935 [Pandoraea pneumonica]